MQKVMGLLAVLLWSLAGAVWARLLGAWLLGPVTTNVNIQGFDGYQPGLPELLPILLWATAVGLGLWHMRPWFEEVKR